VEKSFAAKRTRLSKLGLSAASLTSKSNDPDFYRSIEPLVLRTIVRRFRLRRLFSRSQVDLMILSYLVGLMWKKKAE
jgi:hypothetical protein